MKLFSCWSNLKLMFTAQHEKSFVPVFFKVSIDQSGNLESGKIYYCFFKKKVWKKSGILDPEVCTKPGEISWQNIDKVLSISCFLGKKLVTKH